MVTTGFKALPPKIWQFNQQCYALKTSKHLSWLETWYMTMIAFCGIGCTQCDTYRVTVADDNSLRRETLNGWGGRRILVIWFWRPTSAAVGANLCCAVKRRKSQTAGNAKSIRKKRWKDSWDSCQMLEEDWTPYTRKLPYFGVKHNNKQLTLAATYTTNVLLSLLTDKIFSKV